MRASPSCSEIFKAESNRGHEPTLTELLKGRKAEQSEAFNRLIDVFSEMVRSTKDSEIEQIISDLSGSIHIARYPERVHKDQESQVLAEITQSKEITNAGIPELLSKIFYFNGTNNTPSARLAEGHRFEAEFFLWTSHFLETSRGSQFDYLVTPIGRMEPQVYYDLLMTTGVLMSLLHKNSGRLDSFLREIDESSLDFFRRHQTISIPSTGGTSRYHPSFWALQEGILSLHQLLVMMHSQKVDLPSGSSGLVDSLTTLSHERTPLNHITRALPMGVVGPYAMRGHFFDRPLRLSERGNIVPTDAFKEYITSLRENFLPEVLEQGLDGPTSCLGCPVTSAPSGKPTGVDQLSENFQWIFQKFQ